MRSEEASDNKSKTDNNSSGQIEPEKKRNSKKKNISNNKNDNYEAHRVSAASTASNNHNEKNQEKSSLELTPQFIEMQREKTRAMEQKIRDNNVVTTSTSTKKPPPGPLIRAASVTEGESKLLTRNKLYSTTIPSEDSNNTSASTDYQHDVTTYWENQFQRESISKPSDSTNTKSDKMKQPTPPRNNNEVVASSLTESPSRHVSEPGAFSIEGPHLNGSTGALLSQITTEGTVDTIADIETTTMNQHHPIAQQSTHHTSSSAIPPTESQEDIQLSYSKRSNILEAQMVDDAEPVFYASNVKRDNFKRKLTIVIILGVLVVILILGLVLGLKSEKQECNFDDEACCVDFAAQPIPYVVPLLCYCNQSLDDLYESLTKENIAMAESIQTSAVDNGLMSNLSTNETYRRTSCSVENQLFLSMARTDALLENDTNIFEYAPKTKMESVMSLLRTFIELKGVKWNEKEEWYINPYVCLWFGVECIFIDTVSGLKLSGNDLRGSIPSYIGKMSTLRILDLSHNHHITGTIPAELGNMTALRSLDLSHLSLSSTIPSTLGNLDRMDFLFLSNSNLSGTLPPEVFNSDNLINLDVSRNNLTGSLPTDIGKASRLSVLKLEKNELTGSLPTEMANLSHLNILEIANNKFEGSFPDFLSTMPLLELVDIVDSGLTGEIPSGFCKTTLNRVLVLRCNGIQTVLPCMYCIETFPERIQDEL